MRRRPVLLTEREASAIIDAFCDADSLDEDRLDEKYDDDPTGVHRRNGQARDRVVRKLREAGLLRRSLS